MSPGANSGIGLETVFALATASDKYEIYLGTRSEEKGKAALEEITSARSDVPIQSKVHILELDVTKAESIAAAKAKVEQSFGRLDILINNAGIIVLKPCDSLTNVQETFTTNVFGQVAMTEAFEPLLRQSKTPLLIYMSSNQGSISLRLDPTYKYYNIPGDFYRMSKSALNMYAMCQRVNFASWGCRVCAFNPDFCKTNLTGPDGMEMRIKYGARDARDPAVALLAIVEGKKDEDFVKSGMMDVDGGIINW